MKVTWGHFWKILIAVTCISGYIFKGQKWGHMLGSFEIFKDWITSFGMTEMKSFFRQWSIIFETKFSFERVEQHPTKNNQSDRSIFNQWEVRNQNFLFLLNLLKINLYLALVMATFNRLTDSSKSLLIGSSDDPVFDDLTKEIIMTKFSFPEYDLWKLSKKYIKGLHKV